MLLWLFFFWQHGRCFCWQLREGIRGCCQRAVSYPEWPCAGACVVSYPEWPCVIGLCCVLFWVALCEGLCRGLCCVLPWVALCCLLLWVALCNGLNAAVTASGCPPGCFDNLVTTLQWWFLTTRGSSVIEHREQCVCRCVCVCVYYVFHPDNLTQ